MWKGYAMKCKSCTYKEMKKAGEKGDKKLHKMAVEKKHMMKKDKMKKVSKKK